MSVRDFKTITNNGIPIVGTPRVHEWRPIVTFECSCGKGSPMLITSPDTAAVCTGCGAAYALAQLSYNRQQSEKTANIALMKVNPAPAPPNASRMPQD
jgi:hypothetical protein